MREHHVEMLGLDVAATQASGASCASRWPLPWRRQAEQGLVSPAQLPSESGLDGRDSLGVRAVNAASLAFKKALIERALGADTCEAHHAHTR